MGLMFPTKDIAVGLLVTQRRVLPYCLSSHLQPIEKPFHHKGRITSSTGIVTFSADIVSSSAIIVTSACDIVTSVNGI